MPNAARANGLPRLSVSHKCGRWSYPDAARPRTKPKTCSAVTAGLRGRLRPPVGLEPSTDRLKTVHDQQWDCVTILPSERHLRLQRQPSFAASRAALPPTDAFRTHHAQHERAAATTVREPTADHRKTSSGPRLATRIKSVVVDSNDRKRACGGGAAAASSDRGSRPRSRPAPRHSAKATEQACRHPGCSGHAP